MRKTHDLRCRNECWHGDMTVGISVLPSELDLSVYNRFDTSTDIKNARYSDVRITPNHGTMGLPIANLLSDLPIFHANFPPLQ